MYIVAIAWTYVALMMALAEAFHPNGTVVGAVMTFVLYGVAPVAVLIYIMGTGQRRRLRQLQDAANSAQPDTGRHASTDTVAAVREKT